MSTVKMRKLQISDYVVKRPLLDGGTEDKPYRMKDSLTSLMMHPDLRLNGKELLDVGKVVTRIDDCDKEFIYLTSDEYAKVAKPIEVVKGFGRFDRELVRRVLECLDVEIEPTEVGSVQERESVVDSQNGSGSKKRRRGKKK